MKLCTAEQMRRLDKTAIENYGVPSLELMENAGQGTCAAIVRRFGNPQDRIAVIFVGPGNNGGDGLVIARHLFNQGGKPEIFILGDAAKFKGDAAINLAEATKLPIPIHSILGVDDLAIVRARLAESWIAVDSLFGTGLTREVSGVFHKTIKLINKADCPIIAVDMPSGLHTDTGIPLGIAVQADLTVTFGLAKIGQFTDSGQRCTGTLEIIDIGIPGAAIQEMDIRLELLDEQVGNWLAPRSRSSHKGTYGHLLVMAGSTGKTGAAILCGRGGLRIGTGLVTLCVPRDLNHIFEMAMPETMTIPLPGSENFLTIGDFPAIMEAAAGKQAVVIGPGMGTAAGTVELVNKLYREIELPMVVDADALNILALQPGTLSNPGGPRILTPHPGEMARLTQTNTRDIQADRIQAAIDFAVAQQACVVLKGAGTVIADPAGRAAVNPTGNPGMAAGGMGDVLAGIIGGLLAQGLEPWRAACLGVYVHGLAGDILTTYADFGYLAGELADEIPGAIRQLTG